MTGAYYNENNPFVAQWLRNLMLADLIAPGDVDERSIEDVYPDDLRPYKQCHFFAGIGGWSAALRAAGWADDRPIWSGSCPCQPFSEAGKGIAFADERHLWPAWYWLIGERRPTTIVGEQVAKRDAEPWIDLVCADLEALEYACGAVPFPAAGIGAPHIRERIFWLAHMHGNGRDKKRRGVAKTRHDGLVGDGAAGGMGNAGSAGLSFLQQPSVLQKGRGGEGRAAEQSGGALDGVADPQRCGNRRQAQAADYIGPQADRSADRPSGCGGPPDCGWPGPTNGGWASADWIFCRDGRWRPVEPGSSPLAYGLPAGMGRVRPELQRLAGVAGLDAASIGRAKAYRVGTLKAYGNAIVVPQAALFMEQAMQLMP